MPRINVEEKWFADLRRTMLIGKLGSEAAADGAFLWAIKLAQQYWIPNKEPVPLKTWNGCNMPRALIEVGLAEVINNGAAVYVSGSRDHFAWYEEGVERLRKAGKKGGQISAQRPRDEKGRLLSKQAQAKPNTPKHSPTKPSPSSSSSSSTSTSKKEYMAPNGAECASLEALEEIYKLYPKRTGGQRKQEGMRKLRKLSPEKLPLFTKAVRNYAIDVRASNQEGERFVKQFATFLGEWEEWVDPPYNAEMEKAKVIFGENVFDV